MESHGKIMENDIFTTALSNFVKVTRLRL